MKKLFSVLLVVLMIFALSSCINQSSGSNESLAAGEYTENPSEKQELIKSATHVQKKTLLTEMENDLAQCQKDYNDKVIKLVDMVVTDIYEDHITARTGYKLNNFGTSILKMDAYISAEDIAKVKKNDKISIAGTVQVLTSRNIELRNAVLIENN